jgi:hypothetical protein
MSWRELLTAAYAHRPHPPGMSGRPEFFSAASPADIAAVETALNATLPTSLSSLLQDTDGVMDMLAIDGGDWFESMWLIWPAAELLARNRALRAEQAERSSQQDFSVLVCFADAGTDGILFAFPITAGVCQPEVLVWHPLRDTLTPLAPSLEDFLHGWLTGMISV